MALSLLFFGLNRYLMIDAFRRGYFILLLVNLKCLSVCHSFCADIIFLCQNPTKNKTKLLEQSRFASMVAPACNVRCLSLSYSVTVSKFQKRLSAYG